jgi:hypothetical protein
MRTASASGISCFIVFTVGVLAVAEGQERGPNGRARNPGLPGWCDTPVADRKAEEGCYTMAITELGALPREPLYWHLDTFPDRAAAEAKRGPRSTVVEGHGKQWLFTIAEQTWRPDGGERVATIGPLVVDSGVPHTARYLETVIHAGFQDGAIRRPKRGSARYRQVRCSGISTRIRAALPQRPPAGREERSPSRSASTGFLPSRRRAGVQTVVSGSRSSGRSS